MKDISRMIKSTPVWLTGIVFFLFSMGWAGSAHSSTKAYDFTVFLDDDEIGFQRFVVSAEGARTQIEVEARFDVRYLFITFYSYRHTNTEVWKGECLQEIHAKTDDNGEKFFVQGIRKDEHLQLQTHNGAQVIEGCVKTFAYWNPAWVQSHLLLNSQTGEHQPVEIQTLADEALPVHGTLTSTRHQRITSNKFTIDLWYTMNDEWVGLQSTTQDGKTLRYVLR